ncbi:hypothetical protein AGDE_06568 [Angomonas deanei]|nr:hypothetical protein AGDE_06568 [Angomonas deanei]|eukprot:EPY37366.1 hypothetical protein AGDE_06568 [Angomonas deanei]
MSESAATSKVDLSTVVKLRIERAVQNPFYSVFREEATRQTCTAAETRPGASQGSLPSVLFDKHTLPYYPFHNHQVADQTLSQDSETVPNRVLLVGGKNAQGKFIAEQYLNRGVSVAVFTGDLENVRATYLPIANGERESRQRESQGFVQLGGAGNQSLVNRRSRPTEGVRTEQYVFDSKSSVSKTPRRVTLELIEGDLARFDHIEYAARHASLVYYLASVIQPSDQVRKHWTPFSATENERYGVFLRTFEACLKVDAHFINLVPLWVRHTWLSPSYWYRRFTYPRGFCFAVVHQENTLLRRRGEVSPRCYTGTAAGEELPVWLYWWRIWQSTDLPEDEVHNKSPMRFSLFRLSDVVYPSMNEKVLVAKNNRVDRHVDVVGYGSLDARLLSSTLVRAVSLCSSVIESRIDVAGDMRTGVNMRDTASVFDLFSGLHCE